MDFGIYTEENPLRVCTVFSGYDSQCMALDRLGIPYELVCWSEIDRHAIRAHDAVYPQWADRNLGDITRIDWERAPRFDLFTYSFPCTDISCAGLQRGLAEGTATRSSLLWECRRAIEARRPRYLLMENVKALVSQKFKPDLMRWLEWLDGQGYTNFCKVLNATDYGMPQNRERVFVVSILDADGTASYAFPEPFPLRRRLKDVLEKDVDESYYLSGDVVRSFREAHPEMGGDKLMVSRQLDGRYTQLIAKYRGREWAEAAHLSVQGTERSMNPDVAGCVALLVREDEGCVYRGRVYHDGEGLYLSEGDTFLKSGLPGVSRCLIAGNNDTGVCLLEEVDGGCV